MLYSCCSIIYKGFIIPYIIHIFYIYYTLYIYSLNIPTVIVPKRHVLEEDCSGTRSGDKRHVSNQTCDHGCVFCNPIKLIFYFGIQTYRYLKLNFNRHCYAVNGAFTVKNYLLLVGNN